MTNVCSRNRQRGFRLKLHWRGGGLAPAYLTRARQWLNISFGAFGAVLFYSSRIVPTDPLRQAHCRHFFTMLPCESSWLFQLPAMPKLPLPAPTAQTSFISHAPAMKCSCAARPARLNSPCKGISSRPTMPWKAFWKTCTATESEISFVPGQIIFEILHISSCPSVVKCDLWLNLRHVAERCTLVQRQSV